MTNAPPAILVVDDEVDICRNLADILSDFGYDVDTAHDGESALELVDGKPYDLALLDLKMPGMDGLTLYREIKKRRSGMVAVIVTAYASSETANAALGAGAWKIVPKPVDMQQLIAQVETALDQPLVMVVDDDHDLCQSLWDLLREREFRVCLAHDEQEAAARLQDRNYCVVLIDLKLPEGDGVSVFRLVRQTNPEARTIMITGHRTELDRVVQDVLKEGADAVCYKPFNVEQLLDAIKRLAEKREGEQPA